jgi:hypothetical protein
MVRVVDCPAPLAARCTASGHEAVSGAPLVVQLKVTVTGLRYQPEADFP